MGTTTPSTRAGLLSGTAVTVVLAAILMAVPGVALGDHLEWFAVTLFLALAAGFVGAALFLSRLDDRPTELDVPFLVGFSVPTLVALLLWHLWPAGAPLVATLDGAALSNPARILGAFVVTLWHVGLFLPIGMIHAVPALVIVALGGTISVAIVTVGYDKLG